MTFCNSAYFLIASSSSSILPKLLYPFLPISDSIRVLKERLLDKAMRGCS